MMKPSSSPIQHQTQQDKLHLYLSLFLSKTSTMEQWFFLPILLFSLLFSSPISAATAYSSYPHQRHLLQSSSPSPSPQNIQTFFPSTATSAFVTSSPPTPLPDQAVSSPPSHNDRRLAAAIVATAISSFVASAILFSIIHCLAIKKYHRENTEYAPKVRRHSNISRTKEGMIVEEDGLDVVYWRKLESSAKRCNHCNSVLEASCRTSLSEDDRKVQVLPLLPLGAESSSTPVAPPPAPVPPPPPPPPTKAPPAAPPPPPPRNLPPPPPAPKKNLPPGPPMPPMPPRPNAARSVSSTPPLPVGGPPRNLPGTSVAAQGVKAPTKLRPLHWDKVTALNPEHSMVWDKIDGNSSFRFNDDLMDTLFGYAATNQQSNSNKSSTNPFSSGSSSPSVPTQVCLLDPRKSQNFAIVIRSLGISRQAIIDALLEGRGLSHDTLEKLSKIAPTKEEETRIIDFAGNPSMLADAESFLYHILRAVPSPFARLDAMLFQSNYETEILHLKQSLQTLELACQELKSRGLFIKLLEAILKAGNRMNAGTARGNAKAFNLSALCKLSDVKSADGKTTLLHFVVEEVTRLEGKRLVINRNHSLRRSGSTSSGNSGNLTADSGLLKASRDRKEKEYMMLGLPVVGGLTSELATVKKAAAIDFDALINSCLSIGERIKETRKFMSSCADDGFVKEMKVFLEAASEEIRVVGEEQLRILELVKRTTEYYQPGSSKDKGTQPLLLFVIVRDFLVMFDRVCVDITRNTQKKPAATSTSSGVSSPKAMEEKQKRVVASFPNLPPHFMSENLKASSSSSDEEDDF